MNRIVRRRKPQRSLRTMLVVWFLLFSIVPLAFVTGFSVVKYEKAIDRELAQRLTGNAREVTTIFADISMSLNTHRIRIAKDAGFQYYLSTENIASLQNLLRTQLHSDVSSSMTVFNEDGRMLASVYKSEDGTIHEFKPPNRGAIFLSEQNLLKIKSVPDYEFVEFTNEKKVSFIHFSQHTANNGRVIGYLEQVFDLDPAFLESLKQRMKLELVIMRPNGELVVSTNSDFYLYKKDFFSTRLKQGMNPFSELTLRNEPFGFLMYPQAWGHSQFFLGLAASKAEAKEALKNVNFAFYSVVGAMVVLLVILILSASNAIIRPLSDLVTAIEYMQSSDRPIEIPIKSDTEIGLLTDSFNQMSRSVIQAREDLKKKISELELVNQNLIDTQDQLVHNSKMISLGLLVAGVAHELNNPIGFISSNMAHLKEYADKLIELIELAAKESTIVQRKIEEYDLSYIKSDLPKLINSCQEGAKRTRHIVLGLRNFSRLDEAELKFADVHTMLDTTLSLLSGELKNRIHVHKDFGDLPHVQCLETQMNQVFMNILTNAIQAISGNGEIWIKTRAMKRGGIEQILVSIRDSGKGMKQETVEKIFDPFFSTKEVGQGTGLGLSISYGIIENHKGQINVSSKEGEGTEFEIYIPVKNPDLIRSKGKT